MSRVAPAAPAATSETLLQGRANHQQQQQQQPSVAWGNPNTAVDAMGLI